MYNAKIDFREMRIDVVGSGIIETIFELIRIKYFSHLPSRFMSVFGWETIEDLNKFKEKYLNINDKQHIFKFVKDQPGLKVDMNWLKLADSFAQIYLNAFSYWKQEESKDPCWEIVIPLPATIEKID